MTKEQKLKEIATAMRYTGDKETAEKKKERSEVYKIIFRNVWDDNIGGQDDLSYEICAKACNEVAECDMDMLEGESDDIFYEMECASVYTSDRLAYLNMNNQSEISDKMKELGLDDIATACAVWYDDMVRSVALELRDYVLSDETNE